ncbi:hypothetical protein [Helicobacter cinaedi]|uniref:hypothetical protein n=1 Tax=Helicobacter cinaedi TaxID=213 RepID=UPI000D7C10EB|nr:hypothetical protein [Helicobacter cinaedi]
MDSLIIKKEDIGHVKFCPEDDGYETIKELPNAEVFYEYTEDEYVVFYTFNKHKAKNYKSRKGA